jgi:hypothetical protein
MQSSSETKPEQKQKKTILRSTEIDSISNIFYPEYGQIYDGQAKLMYFNIASSNDFNSWVQQNGIKVAISSNLKERPTFISLLDDKAKSYLNGFFSSLLERAENKSESNQDEKNIKQNYVDKLIQLGKEYGVTLSSGMQTPAQKQDPQSGQPKQDGYGQQASYTPGGDISQIKSNTPQFEQIKDSITRIAASSPLQEGVIHLSRIINFASQLNSLNDANLADYASKITKYVQEVKEIYSADTLDLQANWTRNRDGTYSSPFPGLAESRQLCPYLMQMGYVVNSVRVALLAFYNRYERFFSTEIYNRLSVTILNAIFNLAKRESESWFIL